MSPGKVARCRFDLKVKLVAGMWGDCQVMARIVAGENGEFVPYAEVSGLLDALSRIAVAASQGGTQMARDIALAELERWQS